MSIISCLTVSVATDVDSNNSDTSNLKTCDNAQDDVKYNKQYYDSLKESWESEFYNKRNEEKKRYNYSNNQSEENTVFVDNATSRLDDDTEEKIPFL